MNHAIRYATLVVGIFGMHALAEPARDSLGDPLPGGAVQRLGTTRMRFAGGVSDYTYLEDDRAAVQLGKTLEIWDLAKGKRMSSVDIGERSAASMKLRPDGKALLFAFGPGQVVEWDLAARKTARTWQTGRKLNGATYGPDGKRMLVWRRLPPMLALWDLSTGKKLCEMTSEMSYVQVALIGKDGKTAWAGGGHAHILEQFDLATGKLVAKLWKDYCVYDMTLSADGTRLLVGSRHNGSEWNVATRKMLGRFRGHHGHAVPSVAYCGDPDQILTGSRDGSIRRWNRHKPEKYLARWWPHQGHVRAMQVSPDGKWVLSSDRKLLIETSVETGEPRINWQRHRGIVEAVVFLPDGLRAVSGSRDGTLRVWDVTTGKTLRVIEGAKLGAYCLAASADGKRVIAGCKDGVVREFSLADGKIIRELSGHRGWVRGVTYLAGEAGLLAGSADDGTVRVWSKDASKPIAVLEGHQGSVMSVASLPHGKGLLSAGRDGTVRLWDVASGKCTRVMEGHLGWVESVIALGEHRAASAGRDGVIRVWNLETGSIAGKLDAGTWLTSLAAAPDGKTLYAGDESRNVQVWDTSGGKRLRTLSGHQGVVTDVALSPDGSRLVSASADTTLLVWQTR